MTDDPSRPPESPNLAASVSPSSTGNTGSAAASRGRSAGARTCPNCGARTAAHASVCPECGESLKDRGGRIRCRHCGERSAAELTLCPHCGRELAAAPSRLVTWGIPAALVALFLVLIVRQVDGNNPVTWAQNRMSVERAVSRGAAERGLVVVVTPVEGDAQIVNDAPAEQATPVQAAVVEDAAIAAELTGTEAIVEDELADASDGVELADAPEAQEGEPVATEAAPELMTENSESTVQPDNAEQPPAPTPPAVETAVAAVGDQPLDATPSVEAVVAASDAVSTNTPDPPNPGNAALVAAASLSRAPGLPSATPTNLPTLTPALTSTPTQTPTPAPTDTATPAPMPTYAIQRGDTLVVVARRTGVSVEDLMRVNGISAAEAFTIQPGQELLIPVEGSVGAQEPTATPTLTPTSTAVVPPTDTPVPTPTTPALRLDAPILRSPESGTPASCSEPTSLVWLPVPFMRADDKFVLHLGFVNGRMEDGRDIVVWVLQQPRPANVTSWDMDGGLCSLAPQEYGRRWKWFVEVAEESEGVLRPVSPPSETWEFDWN